MSNADTLLTHHFIIGKTADGMSQRRLALCEPSKADCDHIVKAHMATAMLVRTISTLLPSDNPVLSLIGGDLEKRATEITVALRDVLAVIADTSTDISAQDIQEWAAELRDEAVLTAIGYYDLGAKVEIFSRSMKAVRADRMQPNEERAAAG